MSVFPFNVFFPPSRRTETEQKEVVDLWKDNYNKMKSIADRWENLCYRGSALNDALLKQQMTALQYLLDLAGREADPEKKQEIENEVAQFVKDLNKLINKENI